MTALAVAALILAPPVLLIVGFVGGVAWGRSRELTRVIAFLDDPALNHLDGFDQQEVARLLSHHFLLNAPLRLLHKRFTSRV